MRHFRVGLTHSCLLLVALSCHQQSPAQEVRPVQWGTATRDPAIQLERVTFASGQDQVPAILARPSRRGTYPAVIVLHANWLVEPYIAETAAMLAQAGFVALAVDVYHMAPRVETWEEAQAVPREVTMEAIDKGFRESRMVRNIESGIAFLRTRKEVDPGGVGILGFCGGGWNALITSAQLRDIVAVVAFYAPVNRSDGQHRSPMELLPFITVPVLFHLGTRDVAIDGVAVDSFAVAMIRQGTPIDLHRYDADHGFFAYNRDQRFSDSAATAAWQRTVPFLRRYLPARPKARDLAPRRDDTGLGYLDPESSTMPHGAH
jgi:carboxymethylenebutenolidase